ncbi:MFS transporter [Clostridium thailandense]|uniref:MFS transporter n=1 Tax=Clostridium thailandense TaxID=2794346 RepID=A0A949U0A3_9CLOT|nr:MFS transporter [Clostridium thailandense]MBV7276956.1 MFS transporter [Clostridium thailandense]MCH5137221.1 MFS transporter [Clostridiaceae bacterium UIB06]
MYGKLQSESNKVYKIDDVPLNKFHMRITALTFGANFSDGYSLGIIGIVLTLIGPQMKLNSVWTGLLGASALLGLFFGSLLLGGLADRVGRQKIFITNFLIVTVFSFLQFFVNSPEMLFIIRICIGLALGGDYAVGSTLLAEFAPKKYRGLLMGSLNVLWTFGYVAATFVGYYLQKYGNPGSNWRWMLVSGAIPAAIVLVLRIGTPESPRWLISKGRAEEARNIVTKYLGANVIIDETVSHATNYKTSDLFKKDLLKRTLFGGVFYLCNVLPYFAIYTFLPTILERMNFGEWSFTVDTTLNLFLLIGSIAGLWMIEKFTRRGFTIYSFIILAISLVVLVLLPDNAKVLSLVIFSFFTFVMSAASNLTLVYPAEIFPTEVRGAGVGVVTAISRIGAALGTFALPVVQGKWGINVAMYSMGAVLLIGAIASILWAPETGKLSLEDISH